MEVTKIVTLEIPGEPISKSNSVFSYMNFRTGKPEMFIPGKFQVYEEYLKNAAIDIMKGVVPFPDGPIVFECIYYLSSNRNKDLPNLPKTTCDAFNGVLYTDDSQIVDMSIQKRYNKENPRIVVTIKRPDNWEKNLADKVYSIPDVHNPLKAKKSKKSSSAKEDTAIKDVQPKTRKRRKSTPKVRRPRKRT